VYFSIFIQNQKNKIQINAAAAASADRASRTSDCRNEAADVDFETLFSSVSRSLAKGVSGQLAEWLQVLFS
jgi:hypothetical protein